MTWTWYFASPSASQSLLKAASWWKAVSATFARIRTSETFIWASAAMTEALLDVRGLHAGYGETVILEDVGMQVGNGEALALLGRNGVGKTTLLTSLLGLNTVHQGTVRFSGRDITRLPSHRRARLGLGLVPQEREIFRSLTVEENLQVGAAPGPWTLSRVYELFPRLQERKGNLGHQISGDEQQMLAIGRALIGNPKIVLFDEPFEGLAPLILDGLVDAFRRLRSDGGLSIVLVEQHAELALALTERAIVLDRGRIVWEGASPTLSGDPARLSSLIGLEVAWQRIETMKDTVDKAHCNTRRLHATSRSQEAKKRSRNFAPISHIKLFMSTPSTSSAGSTGTSSQPVGTDPADFAWRAGGASAALCPGKGVHERFSP